MEKKVSSQTFQSVKKIEPYIWLLPSILMMGVMILIPIFTVFQSSFSEISKVGVNRGWNGIANYIAVFNNPTFWNTLKNTLIWTIVVVGLSTAIGFTLAMILNVQFKGRKIARAVIVFPWATALIIQAVVWKYIINPEYGALNTLLHNLRLIDSYINWTATPAAFFAWECWVGIFVTIPFVTFCVLSGLQSIDGALYEAADVDGIGFWGKLFKITLPLVMPSLSVSTVLNIIYVFNSFPIIWTISKGDPADQTHTLVTYLYDLSFSSGKFGEAAAVSVIGFVVLAICASIYMMISLKAEQED
ncbi:MAG: sugar ABC transporter permease [Spirochaetaceae bacterium]|nr:sugar ABC transporter permease [Spirochaetaceae bacterium]MBR2362852.1 sugar ABC transporter permease [Spirochaetaceae bacterium]MBR2463529.1 sugar ABC transporter permease [Spirochaetaceae bacterium]